eukprot:SAG31_NODE_32660_length_353_cov_0.610236_1_plen_91_part_01
MANLYWWETAHRVADANTGVGSSIAWAFGLFNVFALTYISINMFVAVITSIFMDVRSLQNPGGGLTTADQAEMASKSAAQQRQESWTQPWY